MFRVSGWLRSSLLSGFFGCEMGLRASLLWGLSRLGFTLGFLWACFVGGSLSLRVSLRWKVFSHLALRFTSIWFLWLVGETGFTSLGFLVGLLELHVFSLQHYLLGFGWRVQGQGCFTTFLTSLELQGFFGFGLRDLNGSNDWTLYTRVLSLRFTTLFEQYCLETVAYERLQSLIYFAKSLFPIQKNQAEICLSEISISKSNLVAFLVKDLPSL